jgi:hypothetical protein
MTFQSRGLPSFDSRSLWSSLNKRAASSLSLSAGSAAEDALFGSAAQQVAVSQIKTSSVGTFLFMVVFEWFRKN